MLLEYLRELVDAAKVSARQELDQHALAWIHLRIRSIPRGDALELLERLGERLEAKIEVRDGP